MDGNRLNSVNDNNIKERYHGRRRNATFGNLRFRHFNRDEDGQEATTSSGTSFNVHRVREGGIQHRNARFPSSQITSRFKYSLNKNLANIKDKDDDTIMNNQVENATPNSHPRDINTRDFHKADSFHVRNRRHVRTLQKTAGTLGRLVTTKERPIAKTLKIGENNNDSTVKNFPVAIQSHCKLKYIEQNVFDLAVNFLRQYFTCYDKKRDDLLHAYHSKAIFSISINVNSQAANKSANFGSYFKDSRNIKHVPGNEKLFKMLHIGNLDIAAFLVKMPPTEHDLDSLKLDACYFTENMFTFSVVGIFREEKSDEKTRPYRSFQRVFVCVPAANGQMKIVNEQFTLANLSIAQAKILKDASSSIESSNAAAPVNVNESEQLKQNMINEFSKVSNLNSRWSKEYEKNIQELKETLI